MKMSILILVVFILGMVSGDIIDVDIMPTPEPEPERPEDNKRALAHITTDKPVYKPNDMAFIEVYVFDPATHGPA